MSSLPWEFFTLTTKKSLKNCTSEEDGRLPTGGALQERTREDSEVTTNTAHNTKKHAQRQLSTIQAYLVLYQDQALTHVLKLIDMSLADIWGW